MNGDDKVVAFRPKVVEPLPTLVFVCRCGCTTFELQESGAVICANCDEEVNVDTGEWRQRLPARPAVEPEPVVPDSPAVVRMGNSREAIRRTLRQIDDNDLAFIIMCTLRGGVTTWANDEMHDEMGGKRLTWFNRRLAVARRLILKPEN